MFSTLIKDKTSSNLKACLIFTNNKNKICKQREHPNYLTSCVGQISILYFVEDLDMVCCFSDCNKTSELELLYFLFFKIVFYLKKKVFKENRKNTFGS